MKYWYKLLENILFYSAGADFRGDIGHQVKFNAWETLLLALSDLSLARMQPDFLGVLR